MAHLTFVECLDECERGDVVVARPAAACRPAGARSVWFERRAEDGATAELADWPRCGGPGATELPDGLARHVIERSDTLPDGPAP